MRKVCVQTEQCVVKKKLSEKLKYLGVLIFIFYKV